MLSYDYVRGRLEACLTSYTSSRTEDSDTLAIIAKILMKRLQRNADGFAGIVLDDVVGEARSMLTRKNHEAVTERKIREYLKFIQWDTSVRYIFPDTGKYVLVSVWR